MDIQDLAQLLGNFGEFFGAIAVVTTLAYLAVQIRQNTNALRSASYEHWNEIGSNWSDFYARYADELSEMEELSKLSDLSSPQRKIHTAFANKMLNIGETVFLQHQAGILDHEVYETRIGTLLEFFAGQPFMKELWQTTNFRRTPGFEAMLDHHLGEVTEP